MCRRPVPGARQDREGDEGLIAAFNLGVRRHHVDDMPDLLQGGHSLLAPRFGDSGFLGRKIEIFGIGVRNPGFVPRLPSKPDEEPLQGAQGGVERGLAEMIPAPRAHLPSKTGLKPLGLLDVERFKIAKPRCNFRTG
jgi:hypothetical protein